MIKGLMAAFVVVVGLFGSILSQPAMAEGKTHYVAMHVDENDPAKMNIVLNNAANATKYYRSKGDDVKIEIVAHGPGLNMFRADKSPVKDRIAAMALEQDNLVFSACGNTLAGMTKKEGKKPPLISEAHVVPSGVVRLIELQEEGYTYVRP